MGLSSNPANLLSILSATPDLLALNQNYPINAASNKLSIKSTHRKQQLQVSCIS
ncbi:hypothetical protein P26059A_0115 [Curvibacter phage P26059A]|nr:hypothetical protein P26059A_0115 [Curvibacter phage P26059A]